jgi:hypothetical protein
VDPRAGVDALTKREALHLAVMEHLFLASCGYCIRESKEINVCYLPESSWSFSGLAGRFIGFVRKIAKTPISFVCLSTWKYLGSHWKYFREILYWNLFGKSVDKIQVSLKFDENDGYFT